MTDISALSDRVNRLYDRANRLYRQWERAEAAAVTPTQQQAALAAYRAGSAS